MEGLERLAVKTGEQRFGKALLQLPPAPDRIRRRLGAYKLRLAPVAGDGGGAPAAPAAASRSTWKETMPGFMPRNWHTSRAVLLSGLLAMKRRMSSASAGSSASRQSGCSTAWYASMKRLELLYILAAAILGSSICIHFHSEYFNIEQLDIIHFKIKKYTNIL